MTTHKTKLGPVHLDQTGAVEYHVEAPDLKVNGKLCALTRTPVYLTAHGWQVDLYNRLQRHDGGRLTQRGRDKVGTVILQLVQANVTDPLEVEAHRLRLVNRDIEANLRNYEQRLDTLAEQRRRALCDLRAHELPGAAGEIARVLTKEGYTGSPDDLEEMVALLVN